MLKNNDKQWIEFRAEQSYLRRRIFNGLKKCVNTKKGLQITAVYILGMVCIYSYLAKAYNDIVWADGRMLASVVVICSGIILSLTLKS